MKLYSHQNVPLSDLVCLYGLGFCDAIGLLRKSLAPSVHIEFPTVIGTLQLARFPQNAAFGERCEAMTAAVVENVPCLSCRGKHDESAT
jgi:hypothetical protein